MKTILKILLLIFIITAPVFSQWKRITTIPPPYDNNYWLDVYFLPSNPDFGWICGYKGFTLRTTDGGDTWQGSQVGRFKIDSVLLGNKYKYDTIYEYQSTHLESIHFANSLVGYASGANLIFKSTDGGIIWNLVYDSKHIWGCFFISPDTGLAVGGGCGKEKAEFHRTEDGGKTWNTFFDSSFSSALTDAMLFEKNGLGYASSSGIIWRTDDGGRTWFMLSITGGFDWQEEITNFQNSFLVPYSLWCGGGGNVGGLRMSTDYGANWKEFDTGYEMFGTFLIDTLRGWGCGFTNTVYYTSDGGNNWVSKNCGIENIDSLDDIWFINDTLGWVVGRNIYKTQNYDPIYAKITSDGILKFCISDSIRLESEKTYRNYRWSTGDTTKFIYAKKSGTYWLESYNNECDNWHPDSIQIESYQKTNVELMADKPDGICQGDSVLLWVNNIYNDIIWSTNETKNTITVKKEGNYFVTITDSNGCKSSQNIYIKVNPRPKTNINVSGKIGFCEGDSVVLSSQNNFKTYQWFEICNPDSIISSNNWITVFKTGSYKLIVTNDFGCTDTSDAIAVDVWDLDNRLEILAQDNNEYLDFDSLGLTGNVCKPLIISNKSNIPISIPIIYVYRNIEFSIPQKQLPMIVPPGESLNLDICFRPLTLGMRRDTLVLGDTCGSHYIPMFGIGKENKYKSETDCNLEISIGTIDLLSGQYFVVGSAYPNPSTGNFKVDFLYNKNLSQENLNAVLYNYLGKEISQGIIKLDDVSNSGFMSGKIHFANDDLQNGVYYLNISNGNEHKSILLNVVK